MDDPMYPSVQGQPMPDLGLAQFSGVSTPETALGPEMGGHFSDSTPSMYVDEGKLALDNFDHDPIHDLAVMGIDPSVPYFNLELANEFEVKTPGELSAPTSAGEVIMPTFGKPDMSEPSLKPSDLCMQEIEQIPELAPDPTLDDLLDFSKPGGLDITAASGNWTMPDPCSPDLEEYDHPAGLDMQQAIMTPDPQLPDLQSPDLEPEVRMTDRPGDLATDAMDEVESSADYKQLPTSNYKELYMAQDGDNQRRERHEGMRDLGLEKEEGSGSSTDDLRKRRARRDDDGLDF